MFVSWFLDNGSVDSKEVVIYSCVTYKTFLFYDPENGDSCGLTVIYALRWWLNVISSLYFYALHTSLVSCCCRGQIGNAIRCMVMHERFRNKWRRVWQRWWIGGLSWFLLDAEHKDNSASCSIVSPHVDSFLLAPNWHIWSISYLLGGYFSWLKKRFRPPARPTRIRWQIPPRINWATSYQWVS